jgi:hypothetical protein
VANIDRCHWPPRPSGTPKHEWPNVNSCLHTSTSSGTATRRSSKLANFSAAKSREPSDSYFNTLHRAATTAS